MRKIKIQSLKNTLDHWKEDTNQAKTEYIKEIFKENKINSETAIKLLMSLSPNHDEKDRDAAKLLVDSWSDIEQRDFMEELEDV